MRAAAVALLLLCFAIGAAQAVEPDEMLADPALEARARALSQEIRCLVCQNQSIDDSAADLARDLRVILREQIAAGKSDQEVRDYLVARYGDFILLKPPLKPATLALWFGPALFAAMGALGLWLFLRRRRAMPAAALSAEERRLLQARLEEREPGP